MFAVIEMLISPQKSNLNEIICYVLGTMVAFICGIFICKLTVRLKASVVTTGFVGMWFALTMMLFLSLLFLSIIRAVIPLDVLNGIEHFKTEHMNGIIVGTPVNIFWVIIGLSSLWESIKAIRQGKIVSVGKRWGTWVYREDAPVLFWFNVIFLIVVSILILGVPVLRFFHLE